MYISPVRLTSVQLASTQDLDEVVSRIGAARDEGAQLVVLPPLAAVFAKFRLLRRILARALAHGSFPFLVIAIEINGNKAVAA